jgi:YYY domain-containing protein
MHAHMIALPITILVLGWITSLILGKGHIGGETRLLKLIGVGAVLFTGAMTVGALRPTNTWDFPVYLALSLLCIIYFSFKWKSAQNEFWKDIPILNYFWIRLVLFLAAIAGLSMLLYQPFTNWYGAGYNSIELWKGTTTPFWSYITHWGVFLFFIIAWLSGETIDWMAFTPLRSLSKIRPYLWLVQGLLVLVLLLTILLIYVGAGIAWFVLPLAAWAAVIMVRPDLPDIKRVVLFFIGTGLVLTLFVEVFVLKGDIGRMNTVFKFYLQVWTLFAISAAASAWWILERMNAGRMHWGPVYRTAGSLLLLGAAMFPIFGGTDKITDRYVDTASHSLNGINYMNSASYEENGHTMQLAEDLDGIRWMLANVKGSPVIVEGNVVEYRWGNRYTINTGLPGVLGWNWHQRQQRAVTPEEWVTGRVAEIGSFYSTTSIPDSISFLQKYRVKYIVVGQLELAIYPLEGLAKFYQLDGVPWKIVYQKANTTILEVNLGY